MFPSGEKQLCLRDGVIVANPARVVAIVELLRHFSVQAHTLRLSGEERGTKSGLLYEFITSEAYRQPVRRAEEIADDVLELDVQEQRAHEKTWKQRGQLATGLRRQIRELDAQVLAILEG